jgi:hypothetical protein
LLLQRRRRGRLRHHHSWSIHGGLQWRNISGRGDVDVGNIDGGGLERRWDVDGRSAFYQWGLQW